MSFADIFSVYVSLVAPVILPMNPLYCPAVTVHNLPIAGSLLRPAGPALGLKDPTVAVVLIIPAVVPAIVQFLALTTNMPLFFR